MPRSKFGKMPAILRYGNSSSRLRKNKFGKVSGMMIGGIVLFVVVIGVAAFFLTRPKPVEVPSTLVSIPDPDPPYVSAEKAGIPADTVRGQVAEKTINETLQANAQQRKPPPEVTPEDLGGSSENPEDVEEAAQVNAVVADAVADNTPPPLEKSTIKNGGVEGFGQAESGGKMLTGGYTEGECGGSTKPKIIFEFNKGDDIEVDLGTLCWQGQQGKAGPPGAQGDPGLVDYSSVQQALKGKDLDINSLIVGDTQFRPGSRVHLTGYEGCPVDYAGGLATSSGSTCGPSYLKFGEEEGDDNHGRIGMGLFGEKNALDIVGSKGRFIDLHDNTRNKGSLDVAGNTDLRGKATVGGDLRGKGKLNVDGRAWFEENIYAKGTGEVWGDFRTKKNLTVDGNATIGDQMAAKVLKLNKRGKPDSPHTDGHQKIWYDGAWTRLSYGDKTAGLVTGKSYVEDNSTVIGTTSAVGEFTHNIKTPGWVTASGIHQAGKSGYMKADNDLNVFGATDLAKGLKVRGGGATFVDNVSIENRGDAADALTIFPNKGTHSNKYVYFNRNGDMGGINNGLNNVDIPGNLNVRGWTRLHKSTEINYGRNAGNSLAVYTKANKDLYKNSDSGEFKNWGNAEFHNNLWAKTRNGGNLKDGHHTKTVDTNTHPNIYNHYHRGARGEETGSTGIGVSHQGQYPGDGNRGYVR